MPRCRRLSETSAQYPLAPQSGGLKLKDDGQHSLDLAAVSSSSRAAEGERSSFRTSRHQTLGPGDGRSAKSQNAEQFNAVTGRTFEKEVFRQPPLGRVHAFHLAHLLDQEAQGQPRPWFDKIGRAAGRERV